MYIPLLAERAWSSTPRLMGFKQCKMGTLATQCHGRRSSSVFGFPHKLIMSPTHGSFPVRYEVRQLVLSQPTNFCISEEHRSPVVTESLLQQHFLLAVVLCMPASPKQTNRRTRMRVINLACRSWTTLALFGTLGWLKREIGKARICLLLALGRHG